MVTATTDSGAPETVDIDADDSFLERTPTPLLLFLTGVGFVGFGYLLDYLGFDIWAGVTGAFAAVLLAIALLGQLFVWASAYL